MGKRELVALLNLSSWCLVKEIFVKADLMSRIMISIYFPLASRCSFWVMLFSGLIMLVFFWLDFFILPSFFLSLLIWRLRF